MVPVAFLDTMASVGDLKEEKSRPRQDPPTYEQCAQQNRESPLEDPFMHSQGCPRYKVLTKMMRQSRSPTRNQRTLHPKPWGARDPKQIPCTCGPIIMNKGLKSAPGSVRSSPVREVRKILRRETVSPMRKSPSPESSKPLVKEPTGKTEVLKLFEEFCNRSDELGVKLSCATLDGMCHKIKAKFGSRSLSISPKRSATIRPRGAATTDDKKPSETEKRTVITEVFDKRTSSQQSTIHREPSTPRSPSTIRSKVESSNVVVEIAGPNFPEPGAPFPNIFGPMMAHERPFAHYVTLGGGGNQFFGPPDMFVPPVPILTLSDSTDDYIPVREVLSPRSPPPGRRVPSPTRFPRRRP